MRAVCQCAIIIVRAMIFILRRLQALHLLRRLRRLHLRHRQNRRRLRVRRRQSRRGTSLIRRLRTRLLHLPEVD